MSYSINSAQKLQLTSGQLQIGTGTDNVYIVGNVGINTAASTSYALTVSGDINIGNTLYLNGTAFTKKITYSFSNDITNTQLGSNNLLVFTVPKATTINKLTSTITTSTQFTNTLTTTLVNTAFANSYAGGYVTNGGVTNGGLLVSTDGITWTLQQGSVFSTDYYNMAFNGTIYVAVGDSGSVNNNIAYSYDGSNWTKTGGIFTNYAAGIAWSSTLSLWVAVGVGTNTYARSSNGITWTPGGTSVFNYGAYGIVWNGTMFVAAGSGDSASMAYSTNGSTWTAHLNSTKVISNVARAISWNSTQGKWVAVGTGTNNNVACSTDGITWTGAGGAGFYLNGLDAGGYGVANNGSLWIITGRGGNLFSRSTDGITWSSVSSTVFSNQGFGITWVSSINKWIAGGGNTGNCLAYSTDGLTWTGITSTYSTQCRYVGYDAYLSSTLTYSTTASSLFLSASSQNAIELMANIPYVLTGSTTNLKYISLTLSK